MSRSKSEQIKFDEKLKPFFRIENNKYYCLKCNVSIQNRRIQHFNSCKGCGTRRNTIKEAELNVSLFSSMCDMGCGQPATHFYKTSGKAYCSKFASKCIIKIEKDRIKKIGVNPFEGREHHRARLGHSPWNKGLTKENNESVKNQADKIKLHNQIYGNNRRGATHIEETKKLLADQTRQRHAEGWINQCGRAKKIYHNSPIAGEMWVIGSWEKEVAILLDKIGIQWTRNKKRFPYVKDDGKEATYLPDFRLDRFDQFLEVKGFETQLDLCKWRQFPEPLVVIRRYHIKVIKQWNQSEREITEQDFIRLIYDIEKD